MIKDGIAEVEEFVSDVAIRDRLHMNRDKRRRLRGGKRSDEVYNLEVLVRGRAKLCSMRMVRICDVVGKGKVRMMRGSRSMQSDRVIVLASEHTKCS